MRHSIRWAGRRSCVRMDGMYFTLEVVPVIVRSISSAPISVDSWTWMRPGCSVMRRRSEASARM